MFPKKYNKRINNWIERPSDPIMIDSFDGDMQKAVTFYSAQVDRLFLANYLLQTQLKATQEEKRELRQQIQQMEKNQKNSSQQQKKRRHRRCANQIARQYLCQAPRCGKSYGSQGSLSQHMKLKHPELMPQEQRNNECKKQEVKVKKRQRIQQNNRIRISSQENNKRLSDQIQQQNEENQNSDIEEFIEDG